jgi:hypothetical protein
MDIKQLVEWELAVETEVLGENLPQCQILNHKFVTFDRTQADPVDSRRLRAWAIALTVTEVW